MSTRTVDAKTRWAAAPDLPAIEAKAGRENFPVASHLLPRRLRHHLLAIYGFARLVDDIGDEVAADRLRLLDQAEEELLQAFGSEAARSAEALHPVFRELIPTIAVCRLEPKPFLDLIEANRQDQRVTRYETFEDLRGYCRLSAEPVGRLVLAVTGDLTAQRAAWSDDVCTGLQLVEHWQDVGEDARRGRVYLPQQDVRKFGVDESALLADAAGPAFTRLVAFEVERARKLLDAARPLAGSLRGRVRLAISGFAAGGMAALDAIEAAGFDVLRSPVRGRKSRLLVHSLRLFAGVEGRA